MLMSGVRGDDRSEDSSVESLYGPFLQNQAYVDPLDTEKGIRHKRLRPEDSRICSTCALPIMNSPVSLFDSDYSRAISLLPAGMSSIPIERKSHKQICLH